MNMNLIYFKNGTTKDQDIDFTVIRLTILN